MKTLTPQQKFLITESAKYHIKLLEQYSGPEDVSKTLADWRQILEAVK